MAEFEPLARKDRQRLQRASSISRRPSYQRRHFSASLPEQLEVSYDTWNVLQLDSHDDRLDNAGARVRELSAPLAEAGISILYQSSYTSDFIFVKSSRLNQVLEKLSQAGFVGYSFDTPSHISYPSSRPLECGIITMTPTSRGGNGSAVDSVPRRDHGPPSDSSSSLSDADTVAPSSSPLAQAPHTPVSPCTDDVQILNQDIVCVGLSDASADVWASKIIKLIAYPELITRTNSNGIVEKLFEHVATSPSPVDKFETGSAGGTDIPRPRKEFWTYPSPSVSQCSSIDSLSSSEDALPSTTPCTPPGPARDSQPSPRACSRSYPELSEITRPYVTRLNTVSGNLSQAVSSEKKRAQDLVPFFSFTRTAEGSSLTTGREQLAALFSPNERHMVICGEELDMDDESALDHRSRAASPVGASTMKCLQIDLQRFGLDKHGLISRFSKILDCNGINHMYSSTYKTANLLVNKKDALQAAALLRSC